MLLRFTAAICLAWLLARHVPLVRAWGVSVAAWLESPRWAPVAVGVATAIILTAAWGSWRQPPVVHDEAAYLLQARIFATGHWTAPSPPLPEFFEQYHVFVVPRYAAKYPPGHAIFLVPGIWLGLPGMMPVLLGAIAAALIFMIVRRLANGVVAFWTWLWWITTPLVLWALGSYFSQSTSIFAWMLGWYALLRWRDGEERWLLLVAGCVAWLAFTRPLTAVAYALPTGIYVLLRVARTRQYATLARAIALGMGMLLIIPLWSVETTGSVRDTPYALYSRTYFPWDAPGFGFDSSPPMRDLPPDMVALGKEWRASHVAYTPRALPQVFLERGINVARSMWRPPRVILFGFAVIGISALSTEIAFGLTSMLCLLVAYLWFDHAANWIIYYLEPQPVFAMLAALGLWQVIKLIAREEDRSWIPASAGPVAAGISLCLMLVGASFVKATVYNVHDRTLELQRYQRDFLQALETLPSQKAIVFLRYRPGHNPHWSLLYNDPNLEDAKWWIVYDRGPDDWRLMRAAPDRKAFLFDESRNIFYPMPEIRNSAQAEPGSGPVRIAPATGQKTN